MKKLKLKSPQELKKLIIEDRGELLNYIDTLQSSILDYQLILDSIKSNIDSGDKKVSY